MSIDTLLDGGGPTENDEWRRVLVTGTYVPDSDLLVRLRSVEDKPAFEVLTPLRMSDGDTLLVNRGYVRPEQGTQAPPIPAPPTGEVTVEGRIRCRRAPSPVRSRSTRPAPPGVLHRLRPDRTVHRTDLVTGYLQLDDAQPGGLGTIPLPQIDAGPYLSYGLQWLAFGIMAPLVWRTSFVPSCASGGRPSSAPRRLRRPTLSRRPTLPGAAPRRGGRGTDARAGGSHSRRLPAAGRRGLRRKKKTEEAPVTASEAKLADRYGKHR